MFDFIGFVSIHFFLPNSKARAESHPLPPHLVDVHGPTLPHPKASRINRINVLKLLLVLPRFKMHGFYLQAIVLKSRSFRSLKSVTTEYFWPNRVSKDRSRFESIIKTKSRRSVKICDELDSTETESESVRFERFKINYSRTFRKSRCGALDVRQYRKLQCVFRGFSFGIVLAVNEIRSYTAHVPVQQLLHGNVPHDESSHVRRFRRLLNTAYYAYWLESVSSIPFLWSATL